jgi:HSP20 family protein
MLWPRISYGSAWNPWREIDRVQEELSRLYPRRGEPQTFDFPAINVWTGPDGVVLTAELPGVEPDKMDISVAGDTVTVRGSRAVDEPKQGESFHRREREGGQFARSVKLPFEIDPAKVDARFSSGVLTLTLPRAEAEKPKKIAIKAS